MVLTSAQTVQSGPLVSASVVPASPEIDASDLANGVLNLAMTSLDLLFGGQAITDLPDAGNLQGDQLAADNLTIAGNQPFPPPTHAERLRRAEAARKAHYARLARLSHMTRQSRRNAEADSD